LKDVHSHESLGESLREDERRIEKLSSILKKEDSDRYKCSGRFAHEHFREHLQAATEYIQEK